MGLFSIVASRSSAAAALILGLTGCAGNDGPSSFNVHVDTSRAPDALFVDVYFAGGEPTSRAIATPEILSGAAAPVQTAMTWSGAVRVEAGNHDQSVGFGLQSVTSVPTPMYVVGAGIGDTHVAGGIWSGRVSDTDNATLEVALDPALRPELWGSPSDAGPCLRLELETSTVFLTRSDDPDCDGLIGAQDSQPYAFCDPAATGPAHDACL